mmetsp:Transcript_14912/g.41902  ORF Transcript_14912/g.41902 Transcript_14912/m.41902 type:complete len:336 (-) Transcript_14912:92-1099(-)
MPGGGGVVLRVAAAPVVAHGVCVEASVIVEAAGRDGVVATGHGLEALLAVLVPEVEGAVPAGRDKCVVLRVEGHGVHRVYLVVVYPVALEGEVLAAHVVLHVLHSHPAFNGAHEIAVLVWEASHTARLVLERALQLLVHSLRRREVENLQLPVCRADDHEGVVDTHGIDPFRHLLSVDRGAVALPQVPVLDGLVPAAGDEAVHLRDVRELLDGGIVRRHLLLLVCCQSPHLCLLVTAPTENNSPVRVPGTAKHRVTVLNRGFWHALWNHPARTLLRRDLPASHIIVPAGGYQVVGLWAEAQAADAVSGWAGDLGVFVRVVSACRACPGPESAAKS